MHTTWEQTNWINYNPIHRQLITFVVSVMVVALILMIPISLHYDFNPNENVIEVIISKEIKPIETEGKPVVQQQEIKPEVVEKPIAEPSVQNKPEPHLPIVKTVETTPLLVAPKIIEQPVNTPIDEQTAKLPTSGVIYNSAYGKVHLYELDEDFKARTGHEDDFKFREIKQPEWNVVTKLIDEEVDKPRLEMDFYSEGIVGTTERFFDKISYKKTFTTRYGTKITCGGVGPLLMCGWK